MEPNATRLAALLKSDGQQPLSPKDEAGFRLWALLKGVPQSDDYNMRGFYQSLSLPGSQVAEVNPNDQMMHFPDTFKLPNHPSFSTDSGYYNPQTMPNTPSWVGGQIGNTDAQSWSLRRPSGEIVQGEAPYYANGIYSPKKNGAK